MLPYEPISIATTFVVPSLGAATRDVEVHSPNNTTESGILLKDLSIASNNFAALRPAMKNELPTSLP